VTTTPAAAAPGHPHGTVRRARRALLIGVVGLAAAAVALVLEVSHLRRVGNPLGGMVRNTWYGVWVLGWMMVLTLGLRTLRLRNVVRLWLVGFFGAIGAVALGGGLITANVGPGNLRTAILIPVLEEVVKAIPLVVVLILVARGRLQEPAVTDMVILGFAVGAAFGVHEDGLWVRIVADGFGSGIWGTLFPTFLWRAQFVVAHAGWTALVGLGLGLAWHWRRHRLAWVVAAVPFLVATVDHMAINYRGGIGDTLRSVTADGSLAGIILLAGFAVAVLVDWSTRRRHERAHPLPEWYRLGAIASTVRWLPGQAVVKAVSAIVLLGERKARLSAGYGLARMSPSPEAAAPPES
jgi:RsiW-degrading membrane proteinase PrsW (M82 family)